MGPCAAVARLPPDVLMEILAYAAANHNLAMLLWVARLEGVPFGTWGTRLQLRALVGAHGAPGTLLRAAEYGRMGAWTWSTRC